MEVEVGDFNHDNKPDVFVNCIIGSTCFWGMALR